MSRHLFSIDFSAFDFSYKGGKEVFPGRFALESAEQ